MSVTTVGLRKLASSSPSFCWSHAKPVLFLHHHQLATNCSSFSFPCLGHPHKRPILRGAQLSSTRFASAFPLIAEKHAAKDSTTTMTLVSSPVSPPVTTHLYQNVENKNIEDQLRGCGEYENTFFYPPTGPDDSWVNDFHPSVQKFINAANDKTHTECHIGAHINKAIAEDVLVNLKSLKDEDIRQFLYHLRFFALSPGVDDSFYLKVWSQMDVECAERMTSWDLDYQFTIADLLYGLKLVRFSTFHKKLVAKCLRNCGRLTKVHFIRLMYCLNLIRTLPDHYSSAFDIEVHLKSIVDNLSLHEVVVVAMAYFKTETSIKDPKLFEKLLQIVINERKTVDSVSTAVVAKFARFNATFATRQALYKLQEAFFPEVDRLSIMANTHLALIGTKSHIPFMPIVNAAIKKVHDNIKSVRLKELERISLAMTMLDANCVDLGHRIVEELRAPHRQNEVKDYGRCLPAILHYLSIIEIFPHDLIDYVLSDTFRKTYYGKNTERYQRELLCLDLCIKLEVPDYKGSRLDEVTKQHLLKCHVKRVSQMLKPKQSFGQLTSYEKSLSIVSKNLESIMGGPQYFLVCNLLPQHQSIKIVYCTNKVGTLVPIPNRFRALPDHEIKMLGDDDDYSNIDFHVLFVCNKNDFILQENRLTGLAKLQIRQLTKMGYLVKVIFPPFTRNNISNVLQSSTIRKNEIN